MPLANFASALRRMLNGPESATVELPDSGAASPGGLDGLGWLGELHPLVAKRFDLPDTVVGELNLQALAALLPEPVTYEPISAFPPAREDTAVVVESTCTADEVLGVVREAGGKLLSDAGVFDVYEGEQVGGGRKSLAVRLTYSAPDRTLTDDEVAAARAKITERLESIGGALRG